MFINDISSIVLYVAYSSFLLSVSSTFYGRVKIYIACILMYWFLGAEPAGQRSSARGVRCSVVTDWVASPATGSQSSVVPAGRCLRRQQEADASRPSRQLLRRTARRRPATSSLTQSSQRQLQSPDQSNARPRIPIHHPTRSPRPLRSVHGLHVFVVTFLCLRHI